MSASPFLVFPWQRPFLPDLKDFLSSASNGQPGTVLLIVPHNRPWRYLARLYAEEGFKGLLPRVMTLADVVSAWRSQTSATPLHTANVLDRVALLHECVVELAQQDQGLAARFASMKMEHFLPWGLRLANLLEEMLGQRVAAVDLTHVEQEVSGPAAALLGALGRIGRAYVAALQARQWTTPGFDAFTVTEDGVELPRFFAPEQNRPVIMAGFSLLTSSEEALLHRLWQAGGQVCLHADPALALGTAPHWSCEAQAAWLRRWKATARLAVEHSADEAARKPRISFFAGYDCHSQLKALHEELTINGGTTAQDYRQKNLSTAVVLTDSALLMPVLHHLPDKDVNVSMGYPLERSPLNRLLEALLQLQESRTEDGRYYWRNLLQCLRHPYLNLLRADDGSGTPMYLRELLRRMENTIRSGSRFVDMDDLAQQCAPGTHPALGQLFAAVVDVLIHQPGEAETTESMARCLQNICDFLLRNGGDMWRHFPLDAEAMYRLARHAAPVLRQNCLAQTPFPPSVLHGIVREVLQQERVPFEAEPLTGLQVLGMLETRLLHFDRVLIVDATDDKLPGNPAQDPLLPDSLRQVLGLPDARSRERATAHTLYRLCAGAREVRFFWQEGISRSALFDGKKSRSRFVEQLLWEEEQRRGHLLAPGQEPLGIARCVVRSTPAAPKSLPRTAALHNAMLELLQKPLSATRLDVYQQCPLRFAWQYLCRLQPPQEVNEGDDPAAVGTCIHETLRALYEPYLNKEVRRGDISRETLLARFHESLEKADLRRILPPDSCLMLEEAAPVRLQRFLENQPDSTFVAALEEELNVTLALAGGEYSFTGIMDRIDRRDGFAHILDYKTGSLKKHDGSLWGDILFFRRVEGLFAALRTGQAPDSQTLEDMETLFDELRPRLPSLQLPCYVCMAADGRFGPVGDAALVELRDAGREYPLFGGLVDEDLADAVAYCHAALSLVLRHMQLAPAFTARPDRHCDWCPYASLCAG
ncbi:PD-(D/E)XK nuclease family protein [Desulfovibrio desulfuricans]|uniref:PD-(D/E)XK nuclease family protein n=1 Tax=Desulfovibrio desulfuricans TaxID=876 RepID=A0A4P7ULN6_DESDE|nr:PD-(D/E)XK nuclease family protein [Desulfovibrio desulfuricans]QCC85581.1 PD-(D/E)XK nuclease family protein [Desulfovibrio desulfuricans]